ncbi:helix-turn-helix transcriptional regulator [Faecalicatena contorta]|uniref:helix-turn-helix transcriptional regulator n=1 Tax=Faecalicatena contorta TaxID=39482 RepID=UPI001F327CA4|nr:sigma factor-like helix-turn-helix DNA-binding protein [Faecalicatena contorta]MCF2684194.1 sigma-70 family RNA polymerase sigma factor [Faecalicatena contorta]
MAYNKASEERKWHYWKEREEKKLRELGMDEEKIRKLRQMDWEDFLEERRYRERLEETMQEIDAGKSEDGEPFAMDVRELLEHVGDRRLYELLKDTEHQTLEILLLSTWGYSGKEIAKIMGMAEQTVYTKRNRLRKKLKNL